MTNHKKFLYIIDITPPFQPGKNGVFDLLMDCSFYYSNIVNNISFIIVPLNVFIIHWDNKTKSGDHESQEILIDFYDKRKMNPLMIF